jgi:hypothetical protein
VFGSNPIQGGADLALAQSGDSFSWTPTGNVTKFVVYWRDSGTTTRGFNTQIDGGANSARVSNTGASQFNKTIVSAGAAGVHTLKVNWDATAAVTVSIYGVDAYDDTSSRTEITVWNWGIRGGTSAAMLTNTGSPNGGRLAQLAYMPPDLIISEMGVVNDWNNKVGLVTSKANIGTFYDSATVQCDTLFLTPSFSDPAGASGGNDVAIQDSYAAQLFDVANTKGNDVIDWRYQIGSFASAQSAGLLNTDVHPAWAGYSDEADFILNQLGL